ncbi:MAG TPA: GNAT family N-acetyltransferase [Polyangia bacterium]
MITFDRVGIAADPLLRNLYQLYCHDMSEWLGLDAGSDGRFAFDTATLWQADMAVYLARVAGCPAGFGVVASAEPWLARQGARDVKDLFILRRHRHQGVGRALAQHLWREFPGEWLVRVLAGNRPALQFWRGAIREFRGDAFEESVVQHRGRGWIHLRFEGRAPPAQDA